MNTPDYITWAVKPVHHRLNDTAVLDQRAQFRRKSILSVQIKKPNETDKLFRSKLEII